VGQQVRDILYDLEPNGIKTGMLGNTETALSVAEVLGEWMTTRRDKPVLVVDPVLASGGGVSLYETGGNSALLKGLFPLATLVTPNITEAERLTKINIITLRDVKDAARKIKASGAQWVLIKGGHLEEQNDLVTDVLYDGREFHTITAPRISTRPLHGTGCALASCLTAKLVQGFSMQQAVEFATTWLRRRIADAVKIGQGRGIVCQALDEVITSK